MIKFFRKIRQNLLSNGETGKYLKYAVGEIVLVVIGILIALGINNWNESRKENLKEITNLKSLKSELEVSLEELKSDYEITKSFHNSTLKIQGWIKEKTPFSDSMPKDFFLSYQVSNFFPITSTYETFKNGNLELIQSDSLKIIITDIYEAGYKRIESKSSTTRKARTGARIDFYQNNFRVTSDANPDDSLNKLRNSYKAIPNDYENLMNDPKYETLISEAIMIRRVLIRDYEFTIKTVEEGILEIDSYLKTKL